MKNIVIHHSITPRDLTLDKSVRSFSRTHKDRLGQPETSLDLPDDMKNCAYHYVISGDGSKMNTRGIPDNFEIGYHASSLEVNRSSIGICLTGNFDEEEPTDAQIATLKELIKWIRSTPWGKDTEVIGHCEVKGVHKTCPGKNMKPYLPILNNIYPVDYKPNWTTQSSNNCVSYACTNIINNERRKQGATEFLNPEYVAKVAREEMGDYEGGVDTEEELDALKKHNFITNWVKLDTTDHIGGIGDVYSANDVQHDINAYNRPLLMTLLTFERKDKRVDENMEYKKPEGKLRGGHAVVAVDIKGEDIKCHDSNYKEYTYMPLDQTSSRELKLYRLDIQA